MCNVDCYNHLIVKKDFLAFCVIYDGGMRKLGSVFIWGF